MVRSADVELVFPAPFEMIWWLSGYATDKTPYATKPMYFMYTEIMLQFNEYTKHKFGCLYCCISFPSATHKITGILEIYTLDLDLV